MDYLSHYILYPDFKFLWVLESKYKTDRKNFPLWKLTESFEMVEKRMRLHTKSPPKIEEACFPRRDSKLLLKPSQTKPKHEKRFPGKNPSLLLHCHIFFPQPQHRACVFLHYERMRTSQKMERFRVGWRKEVFGFCIICIPFFKGGIYIQGFYGGKS